MGADTLDLGNIERPLLVFGGPYSNFAATERVLMLARDAGFAPNDIVCTGDVVAYCAHPAETVRAVRDAGVHVVMGNCEESLGFGLDDCGCGFTKGGACDLISRSWFTYADSRIDDDARTWMRALPRRITARLAGRRIAFIHGHSSDISGWIFASTSEAEKARHLDALNADIVVGGHCGLPFVSAFADGRAWLNAGVVGMPANDGTPRGWYATLTPATGGTIDAAVRPFDYDSASEGLAMQETGLPDGYRDALTSGFWPNMDVLPEAEKAHCGQSLAAVERSLCANRSAAA